MNVRAVFAAAILSTSSAHAVTTILYVQPSVGSINEILSDTPIPDVATIRTFDLGAVNQTVPWDVSAFTGLSIPPALRSSAERTVNPNWNGSTAVQAYQNSVGFQLHTYSAPSFVRPLKTINLHLDFSESKFVRPWGGQYGANAKLCMGFYAAIPSSWNGDGSRNSSGANFTFRDISSGKPFTVGVMLYASDHIQNFVDVDDGEGATNMVMIGSYFGEQSRITTTPGSAFASLSTSTNEAWYGFCLTPANIASIVDTANSFYSSGQPAFSVATIGLGTASLGTEVFKGDNGTHNGHMAARFREWAILIEH